MVLLSPVAAVVSSFFESILVLLILPLPFLLLSDCISVEIIHGFGVILMSHHMYSIDLC